MTLYKDIGHPDQEQLLRSIVDEEDLTHEQREHFASCPSCASERERIEAGLLRLGQTARELSPTPMRKVILESRERAEYSIMQWNRRGVTGMAAAALMVLVIAIGTIFWSAQPQRQLANLDSQIEQEAELMAEVTRLEDNALPPEYIEIADGSDLDMDPDLDLDEEFMEFVAPAPAGQTHS